MFSFGWSFLEFCVSKKKAVVLLSGGLDSATVLAMVTQQGYDVYALSFQYGQRHKHETLAAKRNALSFELVEHAIIQLDLSAFSGSALINDISVPKANSVEEMGNEIPVTYVPARNTIFLSFALGWAESRGVTDIFVGVNALDYSGYPDCRPEYINAFQKLANLATKKGVTSPGSFKIHAPLIEMTKAEIIKTGLALGVNYAHTTSCYDPNDLGEACGHCDACLLRLKGFEENGLEDPATYQ